MTNATTTQIKEAIDRSINLDEVVHLTIVGDSGDALSVIQEMVDCETDYSFADYEGIDTLDIWGFYADAKKDETIWRLAIRFEETEEETE